MFTTKLKVFSFWNFIQIFYFCSEEFHNFLNLQLQGPISPTTMVIVSIAYCFSKFYLRAEFMLRKVEAFWSCVHCMGTWRLHHCQLFSWQWFNSSCVCVMLMDLNFMSRPKGVLYFAIFKKIISILLSLLFFYFIYMIENEWMFTNFMS